jgi:predicted ATPase
LGAEDGDEFRPLETESGAESEARDLLGATYARFTEGFETGDLKQAKQLLDELGGAPERQTRAA